MNKITYERNKDGLIIYENGYAIDQKEDNIDNETKILEDMERYYYLNKDKLEDKKTLLKLVNEIFNDLSKSFRYGSLIWLFITCFMKCFNAISFEIFSYHFIGFTSVLITSLGFEKIEKNSILKAKEIDEYLSKCELVINNKDTLNSEKSLSIVKYINIKLFNIISNNKYKLIQPINLNSSTSIPISDLEKLISYAEDEEIKPKVKKIGEK